VSPRRKGVALNPEEVAAEVTKAEDDDADA
jgi:hypothetical protein